MVVAHRDALQKALGGVAGVVARMQERVAFRAIRNSGRDEFDDLKEMRALETRHRLITI